MDLDLLKAQITTGALVPHCKVSESSLGDSTSYFVHLSMDDKKDWNNGIYHNSRYAIFCIRDKVELISSGSNMPKFRKGKVKNQDQVVDRIIAYCKSV